MQIWSIAASFTRPNDTTAYASGDLIANSTTAGSVAPMQFALGGNANPGQTRITRVRLRKSGTTNTNSAFRVHLYGASPTVANGDNGAWSTDQAAKYLGSVDGPTTLKAFTDGCADVGFAAAGSEMLIKLDTGTIIYGLLEARAAYTPAAQEVFTVTLESLEAY